jgi:hypothetical protein
MKLALTIVPWTIVPHHSRLGRQVELFDIPNIIGGRGERKQPRFIPDGGTQHTNVYVYFPRPAVEDPHNAEDPYNAPAELVK